MALSRSALSGITIFLLVVVFGTATYLRLQAENSDGDGDVSGVETADGVAVSASEQFSTEIPQPVSGVPALKDTLWISVTASGEAAAIRQAKIVAQVSGVVTAVPTRENQPVSEGRLLVQIDTTEYALDVFSAEARLLQAEGEYRAQILFDDEIVQDASVRNERDRMARAISGLDQSEAELRKARLELERTSVRAPFGGRVADLKVVPGQHVNVGDELVTVVDLNPIKVEIQVLERDIGHLAEGRDVSLTFSAFPGQVFGGRIQTINPVVDSEARTARVTVHVANPQGRLKPGMYALARLAAEEYPDRILVPRAAILERNRRNMLFVFEDGRAKWRYVTTGFQNDSLVELTDGDEDWVEAGEVVLTQGHQYLTHDAAVRLVEDSEAAGGRPNR